MRAHLLGEAKVGELDRAVVRDEQILELQVAVHEALLMHVLEGEQHMRDEQSRVLARELARALQLVVQIAARRVLEHLAGKK